MSSIGLPALNGFIGEFTILLGVFARSKVWATFGAIGIVLGAAYMLWLYQRTMFGKVENPENERLQDLDRREIAYLAPLVVSGGLDGLYPAPFLRRAGTVGAAMVARVEQGLRRQLAAARRRRCRRRTGRAPAAAGARRQPRPTERHGPARDVSRLLLSPAGAGAHHRLAGSRCCSWRRSPTSSAAAALAGSRCSSSAPPRSRGVVATRRRGRTRCWRSTSCSASSSSS